MKNVVCIRNNFHSSMISLWRLIVFLFFLPFLLLYLFIFHFISWIITTLFSLCIIFSSCLSVTLNSQIKMRVCLFVLFFLKKRRFLTKCRWFNLNKMWTLLSSLTTDDSLCAFSLTGFYFSSEFLKFLECNVFIFIIYNSSFFGLPLRLKPFNSLVACLAM